MGMMPLLLLIYSPPFTSGSISIDYFSVFLSLVLVLVPVGIGMLVRAKRPNAAVWLEKLASFVGVVFIALAIVYGAITEAAMFSSPWGVYFAAVLMLLIAAAFGYGAAALFGLENK